MKSSIFLTVFILGFIMTSMTLSASGDDRCDGMETHGTFDPVLSITAPVTCVTNIGFETHGTFDPVLSITTPVTQVMNIGFETREMFEHVSFLYNDCQLEQSNSRHIERKQARTIKWREKHRERYGDPRMWPNSQCKKGTSNDCSIDSKITKPPRLMEPNDKPLTE